MFAPAFFTFGRLLLVGLALAQPSLPSATPSFVHVAPIALPTIATSAKTTTTAVRAYISSTYPGQDPAIATGDTSAGPIQLTTEEAELFEQTNQDREAQGLPDLTLDPLLCAMARNHSMDMAQRKYFDHFAPRPGPVSPMDRYLAALGSRPNYAFLGENIYYRSLTDSDDVSASQANTAFMHSEGHRANIMQPKFIKIGIGFYRDPSTGAFWVTEEFLNNEND
jgi:uncharacterized protein YkwD